jgi:hypothetical protein
LKGAGSMRVCESFNARYVDPTGARFSSMSPARSLQARTHTHTHSQRSDDTHAL